MRTWIKSLFVWLALLLFAVAVAAAPVDMGPIGTGDYRAYWSASYLLRIGQNFADAEQLHKVQNELTGSTLSFVMKTWNPPWLHVLIEPYTIIPFPRATWLWFLTNLGLGFTGITLLGRHLARQETTRRRIPIIAGIFLLSPAALASLVMGQVNFLVLFGLAVFVVQFQNGRDWSAGAALALATIKPHLVYLTLPLLLLESIRRRRWGVLLGFALVLAFLVAVAYFQRQSFISDYLDSISTGRLLDWETPTLGGWLDVSMGWSWAKLLGVGLLPLAILMWLVDPGKNIPRLVEITLFLSVITAPFGWSYDHVIILVPLVHVIIDLMEGGLPRAFSVLWAVLLAVLGTGLLYARTMIENEVRYIAEPLLLLAFYVLIGWHISMANQVSKKSPLLKAEF